MFNKYSILIAVLGLLFIMITTLTAQDKPSEKKADHSTILEKDMQICMDEIASDRQMRENMMSKMMEHTKDDSTGMMQMCKTMMDNPEMHSMMMKMMQGKSKDHEGMIMKDKKMKHNKEPEVKKKSEHEEHHKN